MGRFRDYVGVFSGPVERAASDFEGKLWDLPDIHFDYDEYVAEVQRARSDRRWPTSGSAGGTRPR
ncbi:hypothetical protein AB0I34_30455 [Kribbella sp. NPDC050281]|uniref:hypothetical protein n=1 Tax=Kribbella sp. NPDC050281 TaxID=3155515 RepID=UPI00340CAFF7